ncbi:MAG TPA: hypothetical protein VFV02_04580 [Acidimicrobiales bacterium]|nr:hypothetical protein [Acidimicrobiales bacterium]
MHLSKSAVERAPHRSRSGLRYIDVWEPDQDWDRFAEERLHLAAHGLLSQDLRR